MQCNYVYYTVSTCHRLGSPSFCFFIALCLHTNIPKPLLYNVSVWAHGFVYWKASVFPMTAIEEWGGGGETTEKRESTKLQRKWAVVFKELPYLFNFHLFRISQTKYDRISWLNIPKSLFFLFFFAGWLLLSVQLKSTGSTHKLFRKYREFQCINYIVYKNATLNL